jgi:hypothetical protein
MDDRQIVERRGMSKGGPTTEEGKEVARWNATRHGMRSPAPVVPGIERPEDWERHLAGTLDSLSPEGHLETVLAERVALLSWRLHRATRYETETIALSQEAVEKDLAERRRYSASIAEGIHPDDVRSAHESAKKTQRLLKRLPGLPDDRRLSPEDADSILWAVYGRLDEETELEELEIPGVPEPLDPETISEYEGIAWTAALVRAGISVFAKIAGEEPEDLLEAAAETARLDAIRAKYRAEEVERELREMCRARMLPDVATLQKVARYEAHLSRLLYKAMHELEALQTRRQGGAAPLARLDVEGLSDG